MTRHSASYKSRSAKPAGAQKCTTAGPESGSRALLHAASDVAHKQPHRFWKKVTKLNGDNACWVWTGARNYGGYGQFWVKSLRRSVLAHRISYVLAYGDLPDGKLVCHKCDNPICVRPEHLFAGSQMDNLRDAQRKGRFRPVTRPRGLVQAQLELGAA